MRRVDQELFNAVERGNLSLVKECLNRGANVLARNSHHTVLHSAVRSDNGEVVKLVLKKIKETQGPYIDAKDTEGDTPLMWTAETSYVNAAQVLLEYGADVGAKNNNGMTALHWAAKNNHIEVLKLLIDKGANVNVQDNYGKTPLDCAREEGHGEIAGYLVFSVAEMFRKEEKYNKAWQTYQEAFDIQEVVLGPNHLDTLRTRHNMARVLSDQGKYSEALNIYQKVFDIQKFALRPDHPDTLMTRHNMAVVLREQGKYSEALNIYQEIFDIQKRREADHPDTLMTRYNMAIVFSDQGNYSEALRIFREVLNIQKAKLGSDHPITLLTSRSIKIIQKKKMSIENHLSEEVGDKKAKDGKTPSDIAREEGHEEIAEILDGSDTERESPTYTSLHDAAKDGDLEAVKYLVRKGADVNDTNEDGWTPLHCAVSEGELEVVRFLISKGANIHAKDNTSAGKKSIHVAAMEGCTNIVELFLSRGVDVDDPDTEGRTSLYYAAWKGELDTVEFLVDKGANVHAKKNGGVKPIHAATDGHQEIIGFLLSKGASIDDTNEDGWAPLHYAANDGWLEVVEFLISKGADVHAQVNDGDQALHIAAQGGHLEVVKFLVGKGANVQAKTNGGNNVVHIAAEHGHKDIVEFFLDGEYCYAHVNAFDFPELSQYQRININDANNDGCTALHRASYFGKLEVVRSLINRGADVYAKTKSGKVSAYLANLKGHSSIAALLDKRMEMESDWNIRYNKGSDLYMQGKYDEALKIYQEVFSALKVILSPNHCRILAIRHSIARVFHKQGKLNEALKIYQEVFGTAKLILGPNHEETLGTGNDTASLLAKQGKYSEALDIYQKVLRKRRDVLGPDHPSTLLTSRNIEAVSRKRASGSSIQFHQKQQKAYFHLSEFISNNLQNVSIKPAKQGLYLPSFEKRGVKINGKCVAITRSLSQALLSQGGESFLSNLKTSAEIYERIVQGKQASKREEGEVFAFSKLLSSFERQLDSATNSLPSSLTHTKGYKTFGDLSNYIARIKGDFAIHLVTSNHVVAVYRTGDNYAYFDSNVAFVSGLKSAAQLMEVVEKAVKFAGYEVGEKGFLVEHFDVDKANSQLSNEDKQILAKEIKTERQLLAEQDKELGPIKSMVNRVQLYDFGTKIVSVQRSGRIR
ncbi:MAG: ankyrin repeat domain-containing protein [Wolbachia sp.]